LARDEAGPNGGLVARELALRRTRSLDTGGGGGRDARADHGRARHDVRSTGFSAAASTTFFLGAALFGTLLILPLYYQVDRGESALNAGLLLAPQGIGTGRRLGWRNQWRQSRVKLKEDPCRPCLDLN
jgi:hypothetical protein